MASGGTRKGRDVATTSTSAGAIPQLQKEVAQALVSARKRNPVGPLHVGVVGPGGTPEGEKYAPQVKETLGTMQAHGGTGVLHVYDYVPGGRNNDQPKLAPPELVKKNPTDRGGILVMHHNFDLKHPDRNEPSQSDVVIATRVMGPVLAAEGRDKQGLAARRGIVKALLGKAKPNAEIFTDAFAGKKIRDNHPDVFGDRKFSYKATGTRAHDVAKFSPITARSGPQATPKVKASATLPPPVASAAPRQKKSVRPQVDTSTALAKRQAYADALRKQNKQNKS